MQTPTKIANRFREVVLDGDWVAGTNYKAQLADLSWTQATQQVGDLNTIALLVFHINYYIAGILQVLESGSLDIRDKYSFDLPPIQSAEDWEQLLDKFWTDAEKFAQRIAQMPQERLQEVFVDAKYGTYQRNLDAMIEHCYYHLGQVVLIKKMVMRPV